jgi:hypothetical protein
MFPARADEQIPARADTQVIRKTPQEIEAEPDLSHQHEAQLIAVATDLGKQALLRAAQDSDPAGHALTLPSPSFVSRQA